MKKINLKKNSRKICFSILGGIVFFGTIIGSGFGISHYTHENQDNVAQYNSAPIMDDHYQIVMEVAGLEQSNYSLEQLASGIDQGFDVAGVDQAIVLTSNNDEIMINLPLNWLDDENPFSWQSIEQLQKGLAIAYSYSFVNEDLEFRTVQGDPMFEVSGSGADYDYVLVEDSFTGVVSEPESDGSGDDMTIDLASAHPSISPAIKESSSGYQLIESSTVKYNGGKAYFKLIFNDEDYLDLAIDASTKLSTGAQDNSMLGTAYMWTGYDIYQKLVTTFDKDGWAMAAGASTKNQITTQSESEETDENGEPIMTETAYTVDPLLVYAFMDPVKSEREGSAQIDQENITKRTSAKPFLLSETEVRQAASLFNDGFVEWTPAKALSSNEAKLINEKINYAANSSLNFNYISSSFIYNEKNENAMKILFWTFATIIILVALFIMWYLGLLGVIADLILSILAMIFVMLGAASGVAAGFLFVSTIFFFLLIACGFIILITNKFKYNNDESTTPFSKYKKNLLEITNNNLIPLGLIMLFLFIFGLISPLWIGINAFLAIVFLVLSIIFIFGFYPLLLYKLDVWTSYSTTIRQKRFSNWNLMTGSMMIYQGLETDRYYKKLNILQSEKMAKTFGVVLVFATVITFGFFGVVAGVMGSGVNGASSERAEFKYNVVMQVSKNSPQNVDYNPFNDVEDTLVDEEYLWYFGKDEINNEGRQTTNTTIPWVDTTAADSSKENGYLNSDDPYGQEDIFALGEKYESNITDAFEDNHIKVQETAMVRNDHFGITDKLNPSNDAPIPYWNYGFGYQISSYDALTIEQKSDIETQLNGVSTNDLIIKNGYNIKNNDITINFSLQEETGSLVNTTPLAEENEALPVNTSNGNGLPSLFTPYTQAHDGYRVLIALAVAAIAMLIFAWIMYGWTDAALMFALLFGELLTSFILVFILWIPFGISFWLGLSALGLFSLISKLTISSRGTKKIKVQDSTDLEIYKEAYAKGAKNLLMISLLIWGLGFIFFAIAIAYAGTAAIAGMCMFFIIPPLIILNNLTFYPLLAAIYRHKKDCRKENRLLKDIEDSYDPHQLSEEYISGVNM